MQADSRSGVPAGDVLIVGRIEVVPPLDAREQVLMRQAEQLRGKAHAMLSDEWISLEKPGFAEFSKGVVVEIGEDFYVPQRRTPEILYSGAFIVMNSTARSPRRVDMILPGRIKFRIGAADRAVYIGTIRYHRDAYNGITKLDFIDDFERAKREYVKRFGGEVELRPALPHPVRQLQGSN